METQLQHHPQTKFCQYHVSQVTMKTQEQLQQVAQSLSHTTSTV
jgi:hypothetical protein